LAPGSSDLGFDAELSLGIGEPLTANDDLTGLNGNLTIALVGNPLDTGSGRQAGTVNLNTTTGNFTFVPTANYPSPLFGDSGIAIFDYTISDNDGPSTATATINVTAVNDAPVADAEEYAFEGGRSITQPFESGATEYIAAGADWFYSDNNSDQRTINPNWNQPGFNPIGAAGWTGPAPAELGFSTNNEDQAATQITTGSITYYFQRTFDVAGPIPSMMRLGLVRDDGAIVYVNGVEVERTPSLTCPAAVTHATLANCNGAGAVGNADESRFFVSEFSTAGLNLQPTGNTIAVEVHQVVGTSSDVSFNARLTGGGTGLLANDSDVDDATEQLTVEVVSQAAFTPAVGTLTVASDGTFTFTPANALVTGDFSFTYRLLDPATANSNTVTVTLHVRPASTCTSDADLDNDGDVDRVDLAEFTRAYSSTSAGANGGDINCDARVTLADLVELKRQYGQPVSAAARAPSGDNSDGGLLPGAVDQVLTAVRAGDVSVADRTPRATLLRLQRIDAGPPLSDGQNAAATTPGERTSLRARRHARAATTVRAE
jgi:hypothetical protein